jgi:tRNA A37 threonylcarbamoyladenosine biosynthesis protein TsaE
VEWPERAPEALPPEALHVRLGLQDGARLARLTGPVRWESLIHV